MPSKKILTEAKESEEPCQRCFLRLITTPDHVCKRREELIRCVYCSNIKKACNPFKEEALETMRMPKCQRTERTLQILKKIKLRTRRINKEIRTEAVKASSERDTNVKKEGDETEMDRLFEMSVDNSDNYEKSDTLENSDILDNSDICDNSDNSDTSDYSDQPDLPAILDYSDESDNIYDADIPDNSDESDEFYDAAAQKQLQVSLTEAAQANIETPQVAYLESPEKWWRDN
ncbi:uncharacterized protein N7483_005706 [Penicillium malachiteum]|uniref:uncharacterized protein n=1 Tax=Penicillium malachiteum TaxID=1324776 RepID=UPI002548EE40|nr:uncharacterized protein N7483_005706 [Penicillium malachiteum]KAJ5731198.1 hypothetical protein N7483_005706 [Penicillium malachiteum]